MTILPGSLRPRRRCRPADSSSTAASAVSPSMALSPGAVATRSQVAGTNEGSLRQRRPSVGRQGIPRRVHRRGSGRALPHHVRGPDVLHSVRLDGADAANPRRPARQRVRVPLLQPHDGDIVVFPPPIPSPNDFIKRLIGEPGETLRIHERHRLPQRCSRSSNPYIAQKPNYELEIKNYGIYVDGTPLDPS